MTITSLESVEAIRDDTKSLTSQSKIGEEFEEFDKLQKYTPFYLVFFLHEYFQIFLVYDQEISRAQRVCLYYLSLNMMIAISGLFAEQTDLIASTLLSIITSIILAIPMKVVEKLFKLKNKYVKGLGLLIFIGAIGVSLYTTLTIAALIGTEDANKWTLAYFTSFLIDFSFMGPIGAFFKINVF